MGIIVSHYQDSYESTPIMDHHRGFERLLISGAAPCRSCPTRRIFVRFQRCLFCVLPRVKPFHLSIAGLLEEKYHDGPKLQWPYQDRISAVQTAVSIRGWATQLIMSLMIIRTPNQTILNMALPQNLLTSKIERLICGSKCWAIFVCQTCDMTIAHGWQRTMISYHVLWRAVVLR